MHKKILLFSLFIVFASCSSDSGNDSNENINTPVTDIDGNIYQTVTICNQIWTQKNLQVSRYKNGDIIPQVTDYTEWMNLTTGAWCYYNNDPENESIYGKLYNWYAVVDPRGLAPAGWHIPSGAEWDTLIENCLGVGEAGGKLKEAGTAHWDSPNLLATNSSGFTALPGGYRGFFGFDWIRKTGYFWSTTTTEGDTAKAKHLSLFNTLSNEFRSNTYKSYGFSVRCVKD